MKISNYRKIRFSNFKKFSEILFELRNNLENLVIIRRLLDDY